MFLAPRRKEIDHRTIRLIIGIVALSLAGLTNLFASTPLTSISASYYEGGWSQSIFIGFLFAIAALLLAYNGHSASQMVLSKIASVAGLGIALFPCKCETHVELLPYVHWTAATIMFLVLAFFCYVFWRRSLAKPDWQARVARSSAYAVCGIAIVAAIVVLALDHLLSGAITAHFPRLTFYGEATGLIAFGISWLLASHTLPLLTHSSERFSPLRDLNPD